MRIVRSLQREANSCKCLDPIERPDVLETLCVPLFLNPWKVIIDPPTRGLKLSREPPILASLVGALRLTIEITQEIIENRENR